MAYFSVLILGISLNLIRIDSKLTQYVFSFLTIALMAYIMGTVPINHSFDTSAYEYMYNLPPYTHRFETGYMHMSYFFYVHGFLYQEFRIVSYLIFSIILFLGIRYFTSNLITFFTLYLVFPFFIDVTQVRFFFMYSLVILGVGVIGKNNKISVIIGCLLILSSSLFQSSGLIYILVPIICLLSLDTILRFSKIIVVVFSILSIILHYLSSNSIVSSILSRILVLSGRSDIDSMVALYTQGSSFSLVFFYIVSAIVIIYTFSYFTINTPNEVLSEKKKKCLAAVVIIGAMFTIFLANSADFERFIRVASIPLIIIISNYFDNKHLITKNEIHKNMAIVIILLMLFTTSWRYWDSSVTGRWQYMPYIIKIFDPNLL